MTTTPSQDLHCTPLHSISHTSRNQPHLYKRRRKHNRAVVAVVAAVVAAAVAVAAVLAAVSVVAAPLPQSD